MVRSTPIAAVAGLGLLIAGMLLSTLAGSNNVGFVIGLAAVGPRRVLLTALAFYLVGREEDRDRTKHPLDDPPPRNRRSAAMRPAHIVRYGLPPRSLSPV
jgi:hypothetical protein